MWKRWVGVALVASALDAPVFAAALSVSIDSRQTAILDSDEEITLLVDPWQGDAWSRLALRVTGDASMWKKLAEINKQGENLLTDRVVRVPLGLVKPRLRMLILETLFPDDRVDANGWMHTVVAGGAFEGESLWRIAEWFTGAGTNYTTIRESNRIERFSTRRGDRILIPASLLSLGLLDRVAQRRSNSEIASDEIAAASVEKFDSRTPAPFALGYVPAVESPHAVYHLQKGEALYSSVVIRFTGRVFGKDVNDVVSQIVEFNGIDDVSKIPVGFPVKIPLELLTPEFLPAGDPRREEYEEARRESARLARRIAAKNLEGVHIILDAGHGGRDVGTVHEGVWESTYVYDVACRLKKVLEKKSGATVWMTTKSRSTGFEISDHNSLANRTDHLVVTKPAYPLEDPTVGVNLRWYLANSILQRAVEKQVAGEKVVFLSIHADSLHPSLRGAMAYVPGARFVKGTYKKTGSVYLARAEVRENPTVTQSREEALRAEGLSLELAEAMIASFERSELGVHPFSPIWSNVVRNGREWVPAVIRYNKVPTRLLLEICNMGNESDRALLQTRRVRNTIANAIFEGLLDHFARGDAAGDPPMKSAAR